MRAIAAALSLILGVGFIAIASIGVARLPDAFQRMHAATKAGGIGASLVVFGVVLADSSASPITGALVMLSCCSLRSHPSCWPGMLSVAVEAGNDRGDPLGCARRPAVDDSAAPSP